MMMFNKKLIIVFILTFFVIKISSAATGCIANGAILGQPTAGTRLYTTLVSGTNYNLYGTNIDNPNSIYCVTATGGSCTIQGIFGSYPGYLVEYNLPVGCPIDDYTLAITGLLGLIGFYNLRTKTCLLNEKAS